VVEGAVSPIFKWDVNGPNGTVSDGTPLLPNNTLIQNLQYPVQDRYWRNITYPLQLSVSLLPDATWRGNVTELIIASKTDPNSTVGCIGVHCMTVLYSDSSSSVTPVEWVRHAETTECNITGQINATGNHTFSTDSGTKWTIPLQLMFNRLGDFTITFLAVDSDTGQLLSSPLVVNMDVPD
jgi:hypothetical protein